jgi:hypothetical protein
MAQAMPLVLTDCTQAPDQMDVPSAERRIGVCCLTMLGWLLDGVSGYKKRCVPLHHNVIENGPEDATDYLSGEGTFW